MAQLAQPEYDTELELIEKSVEQELPVAVEHLQEEVGDLARAILHGACGKQHKTLE